MPGLLRCTCGDYARVLCFISHARLWVHWAPGIPCALYFAGRMVFAKLGRIAPRERGIVFEMDRRHCEEQSDEAIQLSIHGAKSGLLRGGRHRARIRATRWLAMTA